METAEINLEPKRLRQVTQSLLDLQSCGGLASAALGLVLFAMNVENILPVRFIGPLLYPLAMATFFLAHRYIPRYYERRFGHVEPSKSTMTPHEAVIFFLAVALFLLFVLYLFISPFVGHRLDAFCASLGGQLHVLIDDPEHLVRFGPILYWLLMLIIGILPAANESRDRDFLLVMNIEAVLWIVFFFYPLHDRAVTRLLLWRIVSAGWLGISIMTMGLYQHIRVALLLPRKQRA